MDTSCCLIKDGSKSKVGITGAGRDSTTWAESSTWPFQPQ